MQSSIVELAKLMKERDNAKQVSFVLGKVVSSYPNLKISDGDDIILSSENLIVTAHLLPHKRSYSTSEHGGTISFTDSLVKGDKVVMISSSDGQKYIVLDRVV